jgi:DNA-binding transcriptional regulator YiaG
MRALTPKCPILNSMLMNLFREFVIMVPLPTERLHPASALPKQHRYRALDVALAASIGSFRSEHDLTLAEVALAVGAAKPSVVSQWENGTNVPSGVRKRRLIVLHEGKRWKVLRDAVIDGGGHAATLAAGGPLVPSRLARGQESSNGW